MATKMRQSLDEFERAFVEETHTDRVRRESLRRTAILRSRLRNLEKVRYIGVDTPETKHPSMPVQCFGQKASEFNERLVGGQRVRLVRDVEARDRYGRLLAYVHRMRDGLFVNAELARLGYAQPLTIAPNVRFADRFATLAREAREDGRGLWSAC